MDFSNVKGIKIPEGKVKSIHKNGTLYWNAEQNIVAGLYDTSNNLLASWDDLVNVYGMDCVNSYSILELDNPSRPKHVLTTNNTLVNGSKLVIGDNVDRIGSFAFYQCSQLITLVFPNSLSHIGGFAFSRCTYLKRADFSMHTTIPTLVSENAFESTPHLQIKVPESLINDWENATNWSALKDKIVDKFTN